MFPGWIISMGAEHQGFVWWLSGTMSCAHPGKLVRLWPQPQKCHTNLRVQNRGTDPGKIRSSVSWNHRQTSLRLIILRSFELSMLGSSSAEETLISEFLISCAAELKAWVLIPCAKELEYLGEYYYNWGFLFKSFATEVGKWRPLFKLFSLPIIALPVW